MRETPYDSEAVLQGLLGRHPHLLPGDQISPADPRRWLLVAREMRVFGDDGADRGSLDHLFLDQDAVPTLVEVKRSENTQIRREVVGQMLDYAANGAAFWSVEEIRNRFEGTCRERGVDHEGVLGAFVGSDAGHEAFWQRVGTNLLAGRIRLIFVADEIPTSLRRIVEFLNGQMNQAEVLAIEVRQHVGPEFRALAPTLIGQTATAQRAKSAGARSVRSWDEPTFFAALEERDPAAVPVAREIFDWAKATATTIAWGNGKQDGSFTPVYQHKGITYPLFTVYTSALFEVLFQYYQNRPLFQAEALRLEKLQRLNSVPGISLPVDRINKRPSVPLSTLSKEGGTRALTAVYEWVIDQILHS